MALVDDGKLDLAVVFLGESNHLNYVDMDSEVSVLGYGIGIILLNIGMYFVIPAFLILQFRKVKSYVRF